MLLQGWWSWGGLTDHASGQRDLPQRAALYSMCSPTLLPPPAPPQNYVSSSSGQWVFIVAWVLALVSGGQQEQRQWAEQRRPKPPNMVGHTCHFIPTSGARLHYSSPPLLSARTWCARLRPGAPLLLLHVPPHSTVPRPSIHWRQPAQHALHRCRLAR